MRLGVTFSVGLHALLILIMWFGLPHLRREPPLLDDMVFVKLTDIADVTNVPAETKSKKKKTKKIEKIKPPKPKPKAPTTTRKPLPKKKKLLINEAKNKISEPVEAEKQAVKTKTSKVSKPIPKSRPTAQNVKPKLKQTPKLPKRPTEKSFTSLLKNLKEAKPTLPEKIKSITDRLRDAAKNQSSQSFEPNQKVTISEIELVRQQISQCWNVTSGARQADALSVEIEMTMNPDATVRQAKVVDSMRMNSDGYYRAAAESALRALSHPDCVPLKLPLTKYKLWKSFIFNFDPKNMLE
jgi:hypothetical protein